MTTVTFNRDSFIEIKVVEFAHVQVMWSCQSDLVTIAVASFSSKSFVLFYCLLPHSCETRVIKAVGVHTFSFFPPCDIKRMLIIKNRLP